MLDAQSQVLCFDIPDQWLGGAEHEDQGLLVVQHRLDGLQMQVNLARAKKKKGGERGKRKREISALLPQVYWGSEKSKKHKSYEISQST